MRRLTEFSAAEWLRLKPIPTAFRQIRNDLFFRAYLRRKCPALPLFLKGLEGRCDRNLVIAVAFERPWIIDWLLRMASRNLRNATLVIVDNSRFPKERAEIAAVCQRHGVPYLPLPPYRTHHANRSHAMAMGWIVRNVVEALRPEVFTFIDHDLIPVAPVDLTELMGGQPLYGLFKPGHRSYWHLWAGYCAFRTSEFPFAKANLLYDFCRGLDTGGRLWSSLYAGLDPVSLHFAKDAREPLLPPGFDRPAGVQMIDDRWMHFEGIGYNDNFEKRGAFFEAVAGALESGRPWQDLRAGGIS
jgi:hypothetical protein